MMKMLFDADADVDDDDDDDADDDDADADSDGHIVHFPLKFHMFHMQLDGWSWGLSG